MKAFIFLAATGLGTLVAWPHMPDMMTIKNEIETAFATASAQLSQTPQPAPSAPSSQNEIVPATPAPEEAPFVAQASPGEVRQTYGEPQHVERSMYGETWYYPVYIIYFRNGFIHRVHRSTSSTASMPCIPPRTAMTSNVAVSSQGLQTATQSWRFSTNSSLGTVKLGGYGVQRANSYGPRQINGESAVSSTSTTYSSYHSGSTYHSTSGVSTMGNASTGTCYRPPTTSTVTAPHPAAVIQHSAPVTTAPTYGRVGY